MKIGLLGTGFGIAHAAICHTHPAVDEVVVFGRTQAKLQKIADEFGFVITTDIDAVYNDPPGRPHRRLPAHAAARRARPPRARCR